MSTAARPNTIRPEIQALRAVAVLSVVLFHLWPDRLTGGYVGVDIFFVISGYLISAHLLRELRDRGRVDLPAFWARRIRRLLPAAALVLVAGLVIVATLTPVTSWQQTVGQFWASLGIVQNWTLAATAVDYFAIDTHGSPFLHYWSLALEEQFYLVWPLLFAGGGVLVRRAGRPRLGVVLVAISAIVAGTSLAYSIAISLTDPSFGYYATPAHAWEFAAGALLALAPVGGPREADARRLGPAGSLVAVGVGFVAIAASAWLLTAETPFPGWIAIVPVAGTLLVIAAGPGMAPLPRRIVGWAPVRFLGDVSYSLYLWHWPLIVAAPALLGRSTSTLERVAILAVSIVLAWLTKILVEDPARRGGLARRRPVATYVAGAVVAGLVAVAGVPVLAQFVQQRDAAIALSASFTSGPCSGAAGLADDAAAGAAPGCGDPFRLDERFHTLTPWLTEIERAGQSEWRTSWSACPGSSATVPDCHYGPADAPVTIAVVGDSHAFQWAHAVLPIAERRGWKVLIRWQPGCPLSEPGSAPGGTGDTEADAGCQAWKASTTDWLAHTGADILVISGFGHKYPDHDVSAADLTRVEDGFASTLDSALAGGNRVLYVEDVPLPTFSVPDCLAGEGAAVDPCTTPREQAVLVDPFGAAARTVSDPRVAVFDATDLICDATTCHGVVGGLPVYSDRHHLARDFLATISPRLEVALDDLLAVPVPG